MISEQCVSVEQCVEHSAWSLNRYLQSFNSHKNQIQQYTCIVKLYAKADLDLFRTDFCLIEMSSSCINLVPVMK